MRRYTTAVVLLAAAAQAQAFTFSLTPVTNTTPNFVPPIQVQGTVTVGAGEVFISPNSMSTQYMAFNAAITAGFNGNGQGFDPGFLAWNGLGTYTGPVFDCQVSANNMGYAGGMPVGLYGTNPLGPGGQSAIILNYVDINGTTQAAAAAYAINVVPAPGAVAMFGLGALLAGRRRR
jgi:hypothetical protein